MASTLFIRGIINACRSYTAALEHSVLLRTDNLQPGTGNTNWFSQDECFESAGCSNCPCLFGVLKFMMYFFLPTSIYDWSRSWQFFFPTLMILSCQPEMQWGHVNCLILFVHVKSWQCLSLLTTSQKSSHVRWNCPGNKARHQGVELHDLQKSLPAPMILLPLALTYKWSLLSHFSGWSHFLTETLPYRDCEHASSLWLFF